MRSCSGHPTVGDEPPFGRPPEPVGGGILETLHPVLVHFADGQCLRIFSEVSNTCRLPVTEFHHAPPPAIALAGRACGARMAIADYSPIGRIDTPGR